LPWIFLYSFKYRPSYGLYFNSSTAKTIEALKPVKTLTIPSDFSAYL
jgi:hypothetical protein